MKKYNIYSDGRIYDTKYEEDMFGTLKKEVSDQVKELEIGDSHTYRDPVSNRDWEIERIV